MFTYTYARYLHACGPPPSPCTTVEYNKKVAEEAYAKDPDLGLDLDLEPRYTMVEVLSSRTGMHFAGVPVTMQVSTFFF